MKRVDQRKAPRELWIGWERDVLMFAKAMGINRPIIISNPDKLAGLKGPLIIHFCGYYHALPKWPEIREALVRLPIPKSQVKFLFHT